MSIYLAKNKLKSILRNSNLEYKINTDIVNYVAEVPGKGILDFEDYTEEELKN